MSPFSFLVLLIWIWPLSPLISLDSFCFVLFCFVLFCFVFNLVDFFQGQALGFVDSL